MNSILLIVLLRQSQCSKEQGIHMAAIGFEETYLEENNNEIDRYKGE